MYSQSHHNIVDYRNNVWSHFCSQGCYTDFMYTYWEEQIRLHPRTEALETPIEVEVVNRTDWRGQPYATKEIKVDETRQT